MTLSLGATFAASVNEEAAQLLLEDDVVETGGEVRSNDGIAIRFENLAEASSWPCVNFGLPTRSGCSKLLRDLQVTRGLASNCVWI